MSLCCVCSHTVVFGLSYEVVIPYVDAVVIVTVVCVLLIVLHVCMLRECEGDGNDGVEEVWLL